MGRNLTLQFCVDFCHTTTQIHPPTPPPSHSSRSLQSARLASCLFFFFFFKLYNIVLVLPNIEMNPPGVNLATFQNLFPHDRIYMTMLFSQFVPTSLSPAVSTSQFSTRFTSIIFLYIWCIYIYIYALIYNACSLSDLLHSL